MSECYFGRPDYVHGADMETARRRRMADWGDTLDWRDMFKRHCQFLWGNAGELYLDERWFSVEEWNAIKALMDWCELDVVERSL